MDIIEYYSRLDVSDSNENLDGLVDDASDFFKSLSHFGFKPGKPFAGTLVVLIFDFLFFTRALFILGSFVCLFELIFKPSHPFLRRLRRNRVIFRAF
jgi:hypothetical protein